MRDSGQYSPLQSSQTGSQARRMLRRLCIQPSPSGKVHAVVRYEPSDNSVHLPILPPAKLPIWTGSAPFARQALVAFETMRSFSAVQVGPPCRHLPRTHQTALTWLGAGGQHDSAGRRIQVGRNEGTTGEPALERGGSIVCGPAPGLVCLRDRWLVARFLTAEHRTSCQTRRLHPGNTSWLLNPSLVVGTSLQRLVP